MGYQRTTETITLASGNELSCQTCTGAVCDSCNAAIELVDAGAEQALYALEVRLSGGYGMYYDNQPVDILLCKNCADGLLGLTPVFRKCMKEQATR